MNDPNWIERERRVRILLESADDYIPPPATALRTESGPAPSRRVPCTDCLKTGRVRVTSGKVVSERPCPVCDGVGWKRRSGGEEPWDEYLEVRVADTRTKTRLRSMTSAELYGAIQRLRRDERIREGDVDVEEFGWVREKQRMEREASYRELRRAIVVLRARYPKAWLGLHRRQFYFLGSDVNDLRQRQEAFAISFLAREMRGEIRIPAWAEQRKANEKKVGVEELHASGLKPGQIAKVLRIPKEKVKRILKSLNAAKDTASEG